MSQFFPSNWIRTPSTARNLSWLLRAKMQTRSSPISPVSPRIVQSTRLANFQDAVRWCCQTQSPTTLLIQLWGILGALYNTCLATSPEHGVYRVEIRTLIVDCTIRAYRWYWGRTGLHLRSEQPRQIPCGRGCPNSVAREKLWHNCAASCIGETDKLKISLTRVQWLLTLIARSRHSLV